MAILGGLVFLMSEVPLYLVRQSLLADRVDGRARNRTLQEREVRLHLPKTRLLRRRADGANKPVSFETQPVS